MKNENLPKFKVPRTVEKPPAVEIKIHSTKGIKEGPGEWEALFIWNSSFNNSRRVPRNLVGSNPFANEEKLVLLAAIESMEAASPYGKAKIFTSCKSFADRANSHDKFWGTVRCGTIEQLQKLNVPTPELWLEFGRRFLGKHKVTVVYTY